MRSDKEYRVLQRRYKQQEPLTQLINVSNVINVTNVVKTGFKNLVNRTICLSSVVGIPNLVK